MEEIVISDCTKERLDALQEEMYGAQFDNDDTFLYLLADELMD